MAGFRWEQDNGIGREEKEIQPSDRQRSPALPALCPNQDRQRLAVAGAEVPAIGGVACDQGARAALRRGGARRPLAFQLNRGQALRPTRVRVAWPAIVAGC